MPVDKKSLKLAIKFMENIVEMNVRERFMIMGLDKGILSLPALSFLLPTKYISKSMINDILWTVIFGKAPKSIWIFWGSAITKKAKRGKAFLRSFLPRTTKDITTIPNIK